MSSKSLEELLAILGDPVIEQSGRDDVELFIEEHNITPSDTSRVSARIIYWFYMKWKEAGRGREDSLFSRVLFFKRFANFFVRGRCDERYYKINCDKFKVLRWEKEEIQRDLKADRLYRKNEKARLKRKRSYPKRRET